MTNIVAILSASNVHAHLHHKSWTKRIYEVMDEAVGECIYKLTPSHILQWNLGYLLGTDEYRSNGLLEFLEAELTTLWLLCKQVSVLLESIKMFACCNKSNFGSYR